MGAQSLHSMSRAVKTIRPHPNYLLKLYLSTLVIFFLFVFPFVFLGLLPELGWTYVLVFVGANIL